MKEGHRALRTCVICRKKESKRKLLRLALDGNRMIVMDPRQVRPGRGAYVCSHCLPKLNWDKRLQRAFRQRAKGLGLERTQSIQNRRCKVQGSISWSPLTCALTITAMI